MWAVVASALAARRGQAIIITVVALLATTAVAAAPWYAVEATQQVGVAAVDGAPVEERLVSVTWRPVPDEPIPPDPIGEIRQRFEPEGFTSVGGAYTTGDLQPAAAGGAPVEVNLAYRENMCDQLIVTGSCPSAAGEVVLPAPLADELGVAVDDEVQVAQTEDEQSTVRLVGVYQVVDPGDPYWGDGYLVGQGESSSEERETAFTALETLPDYTRLAYTNDLVAAPPAFATLDVGELGATLEAGLTDLRRQGYSVTTSGLSTLTDRIARDRQNVTAGVGVGVAVLLLLTWFTLVVVLRAAVLQVRGDVGWWRLHGAPSGRGWVAVLGQSVVPLVGGAVLGTAAGLLLGRRLSGTLEGGADGTALLLTVTLVGLAVVGGLVAVVAAQLGTLRTPVRDLLRRIPARRGRWRRSLVDLVLVGVAAAAVAQALAVGGDTPGLALLAPGLAVLAIALVAAWAVPPLVAWLAARTLHAGRLGVALVAASMARRPGTHRLFALVGVAVALVTTAAAGWDTANRSQWDRAALESGADRVITVASDDSARLLAAVRAADPDGTEAMAVVSRPGLGDHPPMLAVDSTRLGVVAGWRPEYGGEVDEVAAALRPQPPEPALVTTDQLELEAARSDPAGPPVHLRILLRSVETGEPVEAVVGPLSGERDAYPVDASGCAAGCRLVGVQILGPEATDAAEDDATDGYEPPSAGTQVDVYGLTGSDGNAVQAAVLSEPAGWRPALGPRDLGPVIATDDDGLHLTVPELSRGLELERTDWAFVADTPTPLPVLAAGWRPDPNDELRLAPLAGAAVPTEVVRTASLVPHFGEVGAMADLEYAERMVPFALAGGTPQVWLSSTASPSIVTELEEAGLTPLREESLADHLERLRAEGNAVGVRFQAVVAAVGLLLAAGAVLVLAAQERPGRTTELAALRAQGVDAKVVRLVGYGGVAVVIGAAALVGLGAGVVGAVIARVLEPGFVDGWAVLPTAPLHPYAIGGAAAITAVVLGATVIAAAVPLVRRTREAAP